MDCFEYAIVGSGPAGVAAARRLTGARTCLIDVGEQSTHEFPHATLISALQQGDTQALLGRHWEMLANLVEPSHLHPKLRGVALRFVMQGEAFEVRDNSGKVMVHGAGSYAAGGMSNVWGAQLLRYTDADLIQAGGWPFDASILEPYYADLEAHIGISGQVDDMHGFLGGSEPAMPPVPMVPSAQRLYERYLLHKHRASNRNLLLGRARLALATQPGYKRPVHALGETDFFSSKQPGLYTARRTLDELTSGNQIAYLGGYRLLAWKESDTHVELELLDLSVNQKCNIRARHLLLGCGTIQTAKMVLNHHHERGRTLPFLDHPPTLLPVFLPNMFGSVLPERSFPIQLIATVPESKYGNMISFYYPGGLLWSDFLPEIPLPMSATVRMMGALLGGMLVAQIWETVQPCADNRLRLNREGLVVIDYPRRSACAVLSPLLRSLRPLGAYSLKRFASFSPPGWGFHHAGCLPMRASPDDYETHVDGRLWNSKRVRVIDGSVLPSLPAKNHTLTLMANAARIADKVQQCGY